MRIVETLRLTISMRVQLQNDPSAEIFCWILEPLNFIKLLSCNVQTINELIAIVFPDILNNYLDYNWLGNRAILASKKMLMLTQLTFRCNSCDLIYFKSNNNVVDENEVGHFPATFFNSLDIPGIPPHILRLKIDSRLFWCVIWIYQDLWNANRSKGSLQMF